MRRFSANYVYTCQGPPIRNGVVEVDPEGRVVEVIDPMGRELPTTEFHNGVIVPGFVNAHCHTELSYLRGALERGLGLHRFIDGVRGLRGADRQSRGLRAAEAIAGMEREGIVAVADICNTSDSFAAKAASRMQFVDFAEVLGVNPAQAPQALANARALCQQRGGTMRITPHSTYSLSAPLWALVAQGMQGMVTVHYAESPGEALLLEQREGPLAHTFAQWGLDLRALPRATPQEVLRRYIPRDIRLLLVHNTYMEAPEALGLLAWHPDAHFVLCPESNLFIEGRLPNAPLLSQLGASIALGTDSLASAHGLSILTQIQLLTRAFPSIGFETALGWGTVHGARALGLGHQLGTLAPGTRPGLNLIAPFDFERMGLLPQSQVRRLV